MEISHLEALEHPIAWAKSLGLSPVYFTSSNRKEYWVEREAEIRKISSEVWGMLNYAGYLTPWHEKPVFSHQQKTMDRIFYKIEEKGINWQLYCYLVFVTSEHKKWDSPCTLMGGAAGLSWMKKLYDEFGEYIVHQIVTALYKFFELQYKHYGALNIEFKSLIRKDVRAGKSGKYLEVIHKLGHRLVQLHNLEVPFAFWLENKMENFKSFQPKSIPNLITMVNSNGLDPNIEELKERLSDPWTEVKEFLGLPYDCQFVDGFIPKGWQPIAEEYIDPWRIKKVSKDGHYLLDDGSQRRGKYHYIKNTYLCIKCDPVNFNEFKKTWMDPRLYVSTPTWDEYDKWALHPGLWDAEGTATNGISKPVKWRMR